MGNEAGGERVWTLEANESATTRSSTGSTTWCPGAHNGCFDSTGASTTADSTQHPAGLTWGAGTEIQRASA